SVSDGQAIIAGEDGVRLSVPVMGAAPAPGTRLFGSVRRDRITVSKLAAGTRPVPKVNALSGEVHAIEYQGSYVKVTIDRPGGEEFVANVADEAFFREALDIGNGVEARWSGRDVLALEAGEDAAEQPIGEVSGALL